MGTAFDQTLDLRGVHCPMPLVESSKAIKALPFGKVLKVITYLPGSMAVQGIISNVKNVEQVEKVTTSEDGNDLYTHYLRRTK